MVAQTTKPKRKARTTRTAKPTTTQQSILKVKKEHPDLSTRQIATLANCDHSNVVRCLQRYGIDQQRTLDFKQNESILITALRDRIYHSITDADLQKTPVGSRLMSYGILFDKNQLLDGKATSHIAIHSDIIEHKRLIRASREPGGTGQKLKE